MVEELEKSARRTATALFYRPKEIAAKRRSGGFSADSAANSKIKGY
jgi:hypothetical protein